MDESFGPTSSAAPEAPPVRAATDAARAATGTWAAVGYSTERRADLAGLQAARSACAGLPRPPACCLVFAGTAYPQDELLAAITAEVGAAAVVGCSGEGVIAGPISDEGDHMVAVMALASSTIRFEVLTRADYASDPDGCGRALAEDIVARTVDPFAVLLFVDGLTGHCTHFLDAVQAGLPPSVVVAGGAAGDRMEFVQTYQYAGARALSGAVTALVLSGAGRVRVGVSHGCVPIGLERTVTSAGDGWLREIDGRPAWDVFKEYLDGDPIDLNAEGIVHLCFGEPLPADLAQQYDPFIIRTPLKLEAATGALFLPGGGFVAGDRVRLTRRDPGRIHLSAARCAATLVEQVRPAFVVQFDCAGRGRILFGERVAEDTLHPLQHALGADVPWIGLHTYGEIAAIGDRLRYHNYTVALCAVFDDALDRPVAAP